MLFASISITFKMKLSAMINLNKKQSIIVLLAALLMLMPLSGNAQSITRNKKQQTTKTTKKSKEGGSSNNSGKSRKSSKTTAQQSASHSSSSSSSSHQVSYTPKVETFTVNGVSFDMIWVEGGSFTMGATKEQGNDVGSNEKPAHQVKLSNYYIGKYEVTQELWLAVMGRNPSRNQGDMKRPVEMVNWYDCQEFITKLNQLTGKQFRLPTEAEWEFAARGGNFSQGYKYSGSNTFEDVAWNNATPHSVGSKYPNELGLYDMSGNVREWCQDWFGKYSRGAQTNPTGPSSGTSRVDRSGNGTSIRDAYGPMNRLDYIGLRLAATSL